MCTIDPMEPHKHRGPSISFVLSTLFLDALALNAARQSLEGDPEHSRTQTIAPLVTHPVSVCSGIAVQAADGSPERDLFMTAAIAFGEFINTQDDAGFKRIQNALDAIEKHFADTPFL